MEQKQPSPPKVTPGILFLAFLEVALSGFGGALPWARRTLVEKRGWLTEREFAEILGVCQVLPGGNVINVAVFVGTRFCGPLGALAAFAGLLLAPLLIMCLLGVLYTYGAQLEFVRSGLRGVASVAVGLLLAMGLKVALAFRRDPSAIAFAALAFLGVGVLRLPLIPVLLVLAPCSIALAWRRSQ